MTMFEYQCPKCGSHKGLILTALLDFEIEQEDFDPDDQLHVSDTFQYEPVPGQDLGFDDDSPMCCGNVVCGHEGKVREFRTPEEG
jgi:hypothetical protein